MFGCVRSMGMQEVSAGLPPLSYHTLHELPAEGDNEREWVLFGGELRQSSQPYEDAHRMTESVRTVLMIERHDAVAIMMTAQCRVS